MKDWLFFSLLALLAWGFWAFLPKLALIWLDPKSAFVYETIGAALTGALVFFILRPEMGTEMAGVVPSLLTGAAGCLGILCFLYAIRAGKVSVVAPLTALYPVVSLALALVFFREKLSLTQIAGVAFAALSVILLSHE